MTAYCKIKRTFLLAETKEELQRIVNICSEYIRQEDVCQETSITLYAKFVSRLYKVKNAITVVSIHPRFSDLSEDAKIFLSNYTIVYMNELEKPPDFLGSIGATIPDDHEAIDATLDRIGENMFRAFLEGYCEGHNNALKMLSSIISAVRSIYESYEEALLYISDKSPNISISLR